MVVLHGPGTLESVSETLYDEAGRVYRTISGRVPISVSSVQSVAQSAALDDFLIYSDGVDRYASENLTTGIISDTLFDSRGRQFASVSHPLPAEDVGLGDVYPGQLVRMRSETIYNRYGQAETSRSGLAQVENSDGSLVGVFDQQSVDMHSTFDAFGNVVRTDYITGGDLTLPSAENPAFYAAYFG